MKKFNYKRQINTQTIVVDKMKKVISIQRRLYFTFFTIFLLLIVAYLVYGIYIKTYDGYLIARTRVENLIDDATIVDINVRRGQKIEKGDTLFSYMFTNFILGAINPNGVDNFDKEIIDSKIKASELISKKRLSDRSVDSLSNILASLRRTLSMGIITIDEVQKKEWELFELKENNRLIKDLIKINQEYEQIYSNKSFQSITSQYGRNFIENNLVDSTLRYKLAIEDAIIVDVQATDWSIVYKKDPVMTIFTYDNPKITDLHALGIIPPDVYEEISDGDRVDVYSGDLFLGKATIKLNASYMMEVDYRKISTFSSGSEAVAVRIEFDNPKGIEVKYLINKLPIKIKYSRVNFLKRWFDNLIEQWNSVSLS